MNWSGSRFPENSQDYFVVVFNDSRYFGWESTPYQSRETVLTSILLTPDELGLSPGTWYWRICYSWTSTTAGTRYLDDDIRRLDVETPIFLTRAEARNVVRSAIRRRFGRRVLWTRRVRVSDRTISCRAYWRNSFGRLRAAA